MGTMRPIKDIEILEKIKEVLREHSTRNYLLFRLGINLGLTAQDLLLIRIEDILDKEAFINSPEYPILICPDLQKEIQEYTGNRKEGLLFLSSHGKALSRFQLYGILKNAAREAGFEEEVGSVTLRKTFAYWAYKKRRIHLPLISKYLKHHTIQHTLRYIEVEKEGPNAYLAAVDL